MARRQEESEGGGYIGRLPEECISHVLSFTTPRDACRSALVSAAFHSAASSDALWQRFLPSDYESILSRAVDPVEYSSKRELYLRLCDSILVDGGQMSFGLEKSTGRKCYMISPRIMNIVWSYEPQYWRWLSLAESRFAEVAELLTVCWLEVNGNIDTRLLSPRTTYVAYLVFKLASESYGLGPPPQLASVRLGAYASEIDVCLQDDDDDDGDGDDSDDDDDQEEGGRWQQRRHLRDDGWMEIELGEFYNDVGDDGDVEMSCSSVKALHWKSGLIVQGLEVRPKI
ncbi:F-box protein PP2-B11-like [Elaeis guineensis]|uniref:F-box protein PP2-B11-like n=1 Tax=Elaeis guineensis var. tenera TaxID=51953 RepID=A0A6I9RD19_ELAGV|nr:F-box protein PP2-B11-like [Elaeis guineensis]